MPLSDDELDAITRTVLGEASSSPIEQAAVAHVIKNRMDIGSAGGYADTANDVVHQPGAFEAWSNPQAPNYPDKFKSGSDQYKSARATVEGVFNGTITDPTGGYTHFLEPTEMARRGTWPSWASGDGKRFGAQVFYPPDAKAKQAMSDADSADTYLRQFTTKDETTPQPATGGVQGGDAEAYLRQYATSESPAKAPPRPEVGVDKQGLATDANKYVKQSFEGGGGEEDFEHSFYTPSGKLPEGETQQKFHNLMKSPEGRQMFGLLASTLMPGSRLGAEATPFLAGLGLKGVQHALKRGWAGTELAGGVAGGTALYETLKSLLSGDK